MSKENVCTQDEKDAKIKRLEKAVEVLATCMADLQYFTQKSFGILPLTDSRGVYISPDGWKADWKARFDAAIENEGEGK